MRERLREMKRKDVCERERERERERTKCSLSSVMNPRVLDYSSSTGGQPSTRTKSQWSTAQDWTTMKLKWKYTLSEHIRVREPELRGCLEVNGFGIFQPNSPKNREASKIIGKVYKLNKNLDLREKGYLVLEIISIQTHYKHYKPHAQHSHQQQFNSHFSLSLCLNLPFKGGQEFRSGRR